MPISFNRIVAFLLIPSLIGDPVLAAVMPQHVALLQPDSISTFGEQALTPHLVGAFRKPFDALAAGLSRLLPHLQPAEGWLDYVRVNRKLNRFSWDAYRPHQSIKNRLRSIFLSENQNGDSSDSSSTAKQHPAKEFDQKLREAGLVLTKGEDGQSFIIRRWTREGFGDVTLAAITRTNVDIGTGAEPYAALIRDIAGQFDDVYAYLSRPPWDKELRGAFGWVERRAGITNIIGIQPTREHALDSSYMPFPIIPFVGLGLPKAVIIPPATFDAEYPVKAYVDIAQFRRSDASALLHSHRLLIIKEFFRSWYHLGNDLQAPDATERELVLTATALKSIPEVFFDEAESEMTPEEKLLRAIFGESTTDNLPLYKKLGFESTQEMASASLTQLAERLAPVLGTPTPSESQLIKVHNRIMLSESLVGALYPSLERREIQVYHGRISTLEELKAGKIYMDAERRSLVSAQDQFNSHIVKSLGIPWELLLTMITDLENGISLPQEITPAQKWYVEALMAMHQEVLQLVPIYLQRIKKKPSSTVIRSALAATWTEYVDLLALVEKNKGEKADVWARPLASLIVVRISDRISYEGHALKDARKRIRAFDKALRHFILLRKSNVEKLVAIEDSLRELRQTSPLLATTIAEGMLTARFSLENASSIVELMRDERAEEMKPLLRLIETLHSSDFQGSRGRQLQQAMVRLRQATTDYNRNAVYELLFSKDHMKWLSQSDGDAVNHLSFYADVMQRYPRTGLQLLEGILQAIRAKAISGGLGDSERAQVHEFVGIMNTFSPELFKLYQEKGKNALETLFAFSHRILKDEVGPEEIKQILTQYATPADDGYGILSAAVQIAIPASGASFVKRDQVTGLLRRYAQLGDHREDIPDTLRNKNFGGGDEEAIDLAEWTLKPGAVYDPEGIVADIIDKLRYQDALLEPAEAAREMEQDQVALLAALEAFFQDQTPETAQAEREAFYQFASHNDQLGEKVDRINVRSFEGLNLLEQLFVDKENLYHLLKTNVDALLSKKQELRPRVSTETNQPIRNPKSLSQQIIGIWRSSGERSDVAKSKLETVLKGVSLKALGADVLPLLPEHLRAQIFDIATGAAPLRPMSTPEILNQLLEPTAHSIESEKAKFEPTQTGRRIALEFRVVKGIPYSLWGLSAGVCIATDLELWKKPEFMLLAMIDKQTEQVVGFIHLFKVERDGKRILTLPGIEPSVEFLSNVKPRDIYPLIERAVSRVGRLGGFDSVVLPEEANILSNRTGITSEAQKRGYVRREFAAPVSWNHLPTPYPFSKVYEIWSARTGKGSEKGVVLNSNGAYQIEMFLNRHPFLQSVIVFAFGSSLAINVLSASEMLSPTSQIVMAITVGYLTFRRSLTDMMITPFKRTTAIQSIRKVMAAA